MALRPYNKSKRAWRRINSPVNSSELAKEQLPSIVSSLVSERDNVPGVYSNTSQSLEKIIKEINAIIQKGERDVIVEPRDEEPYTITLPITVSDYKELIQTLSLAFREFTSMHLLPYGSSSPTATAVKEIKEQQKGAIRHEHYHLHGAAQQPIASLEGKPLDVIALPSSIDSELIED